LARYARAAGEEVVEKVLWLFYAAQSPATPRWAKTAIYGALGYFIFPLDAIPDLAPMVGYTDDLGVLAAALTTVAFYINDDIKARTRDRKSTRLNSSHVKISYAVFCLKKKKPYDKPKEIHNERIR